MSKTVTQIQSLTLEDISKYGKQRYKKYVKGKLVQEGVIGEYPIKSGDILELPAKPHTDGKLEFIPFKLFVVA